MGIISELNKKIADGTATEEEKAQLAELKKEASESDNTDDQEKLVNDLVAKFLKKVNTEKEATETKTEIKETNVISKDAYGKMDKDVKVKEFITALLENNHQKLQVMAEGTNALGGYLVP